jgi:hypothetical protein
MSIKFALCYDLSCSYHEGEGFKYDDGDDRPIYSLHKKVDTLLVQGFKYDDENDQTIDSLYKKVDSLLVQCPNNHTNKIKVKNLFKDTPVASPAPDY